MKTKRICKSTVSLLLVFMMLVSMLTVGIVNTSAAEVDTAETGESGVYLRGGTINNWGWGDKFQLQSGTIYKLDFTFNSTGEHWIQIHYDHNNYRANSEINDVTDASGVTLQQYNDNFKWKVSTGGTYTFTFDTSTKVLTITNPNNTGGDTTPTVEPTVAPTEKPTTPSGGGSSSDTFPFTFTEGDRTIYLVDKAGWGSAKCYAWKSGTTTSNAGWPGVNMSDTGKTMNGYKIYSYEVASTYDMVIFYNSDDNRTVDLTYTQYAYYTNSDNAWTTVGATGGTDDPDDPTTLKTLYFMDNSPDQFMDNFDADIFASFDSGKKQQMKQRVDTISGKTLWSIDIPDGATNVKFYRYSKLDELWGEWSTVSLSDKRSGYYKAVSGSGSWESDESTFSPSSDEDITNFWYGAWVDTRNSGEGKDAVRWWKDSNGQRHIFLPSHTPSTFRLYSSFDSISLGGKTATKGNYIELSPTDGQKLTGDYIPVGGSSSTGLSIVFHRSENVSSLMLFTNDQFWTDTIYSDTQDKELISNYKDGIETKGNIYLYDKEGNLVNNVVNDEKDQTVLKKIKGRGNSSFEASMKLYGKYAYNFNLDEKVALVDGATATKKWCLLANNVDHAMLRNTFAYNLANDIGLAYSPKTRHVDVYDNGEYIGAYTIIEKVEYGKDKSLMKDLESLDDEHESWYEKSTIYDEDVDYDDDSVIKSVGSKNSPISYTTSSGNTYQYKYWTSNNSNFTYEHADDTFKTKFNFLLEHELDERYDSEASWFISAKGQHVVVKYPEFATQKEMMWAMDMYDKLEKAAYTTQTLTAIEAAADAESFAKMYLIQELGLNLDACATSYYMYNDRATNKLVAGPVWDFDWSFGSYHKTKVKYNGASSNLSNPNQMYVKDKDMNNNIDTGWSGTRNLQAQLTQTADYWTLCKKIWTNDAQPAIKTYIDENTNDSTDTGILLGWMNDIEASVEMNSIRWPGAYSEDESADWGTKLTSDYTKGSYDFQYTQGHTSGSATKSYKNTVYYLNDWIKTRMDYMSNSGGLYDASLVDPYKLNSVTLNATQSGADVRVSVAFDATYNGTQVSNDDKRFELYVDGKFVSDHAITETPIVTLTENVETKIHVIAYINGKKDTHSLTSATEEFTYVVTGPEYKVDNVTFTAVQSDDKSKVTVTPTATVTCDGEEVKPNKINYTIYRNGTAYVTNTFETKSVVVPLVSGQVNEIYIVVTPVDNTNVSGTSITQKFSYNVEVEKVTATLYFKSSSSIRYVPKIQVNKGEAVKMTQDGDAIGKNASQTQSYFWYKKEVEIEKDVDTKITFTNEYSMNASTTLTISAAETFYFGVDNLNNGTEVVDLTGKDENILNFKLSASHMVYNDPTSTELATTSIDGKIYKMGDANEDNKFNITDATAIQRALAELDTLSETGEALADFNLDGTKSITDVTYEQMKLAS